jgi:hypothetical protein
MREVFFVEITFTRTGPSRILKNPCGTVQKDVRGTFKSGLGKWGNEVVATFNITSFSRNEKSRTIVKNDHARIDLQGMFDQYGKRWANLQIQWNGNHPSSIIFGTVFLQAKKTFPIRLVRNAFVQSMLRCAKVWLEVPPKREYLKTQNKIHFNEI